MVVVSLALLSGCGSCLEDKKVPETEQTPPTIKTITKTTEAGTRPVVVSDGVNLSGIVNRDGGS
ncbi:MAG: hypothetical protein KF795_31825 [Labilithrix sp.]|nr:hypothetical protein [Labilithrix sp.]